MVKDLSAYYEALKAKRLAALEETKAPVDEPIVVEQAEQLEETLYTTSHGYDIFVEDDVYFFRDNGTKYTSRNFMKLEDKALELKDLNKPLVEEPDVIDNIILTHKHEGLYSFSSPWGDGTVSVTVYNPTKDRIYIRCGNNHFTGEAKAGFYTGNPERLKDLIRTNLNTDTVSESHKFREWSNASGKTAFEQLYGDDND